MADFDSDDAVFDESFFDEEDEEQQPTGRIKMARLKRDIKRADIETKVQKARQVVAKAEEFAADLGDTTTEAPAVTTAATQLEQKYNTARTDRQTSVASTNAQNLAEDNLDAKIETLYRKMETNTEGNPDKLIKSGVELVQPGTAAPVGQLPKVENLACSIGDFDGTSDEQWDKVRGAVYYIIQATATPDNAASWATIGTSPRSTFHATNLPSGTLQFMRVAAVGTAGQGPWSEVGNVRIP